VGWALLLWERAPRKKEFADPIENAAQRWLGDGLSSREIEKRTLKVPSTTWYKSFGSREWGWGKKRKRYTHGWRIRPPIKKSCGSPEGF